MIASRIAACLLLTLTVRLGAEQPTILPPPPGAADQPGATATWSPGHWLWTGSQWSWCPGSWQISRPTSPSPRWIEGQWVADAGGTVWVPGHYQGGTAASGSASASVEAVGFAPSTAPPPQETVVYASPTVVDTVYLDRPVYSETVVAAPVCVSVYAPVCAPPPVAVGVRVGHPLCLPLPPLPPLPAISHHGFGFGRLALPFFNPLSLLFHHH